jgi:hypothetical protein
MLLILNGRRVGVITPRNQWPVYWAAIGGAALVQSFARYYGVPYFLLINFFAMVFELKAWANPATRAKNYWNLRYSLLVFAAAEVAWQLDYQGIVCDPSNHFIQGHAVWHVLNSISLLFMFRYMKQFGIR